MRYFFLLFILFSFSQLSIGQRNTSFEGLLTYQITNVKEGDSVQMKTIVFCKDSLIKVVSFNEKTGRQELLKHLTYNKSYILLELDNQKIAVRTNEHLQKDSVTYSIEKKCGRKKIGPIKSRKIQVKYQENKHPLTCYYSKKISNKYANAMSEFPGLPTLFYTFSDRQIFRHTLIEFEKKELPLSFFMIPKDYTIIDWDDFILKFSER